MTTEELAKLGRAMRDHQKAYFRTKSGASLEASKGAEKRFDDAVAEILNPQRGLFDPPPKCDHAWLATNTGWECQKCGRETEDPPRGVAKVVEPPPPGTVK